MSSQWEVRWSSSRSRPYFYDPVSRQSIWEAPPALTPEQVKALPGAEMLDGKPPANSSGRGGSENKIRASHLLVKHEGSRRPSSWKEEHITRPLSEALDTTRNHEKSLQAIPSSDLPIKFAELAKTESDCSSAKNGGDLGWFAKGQMQTEFETAAYALEVGQMSEPIQSASGVHLILRTG